uniref:Uncharacterized protein n=1 Tax=Euplotes harpa TaxID=151035 RepID=A0A7S3N8L6_9SPIT|mmetsp:Transcript_23654/g.27171  ORF Transcript_23654/g.27171 Transcript_23654/m.27171 type:complete len:101 (+) Transcript_23654:490-792(+)
MFFMLWCVLQYLRILLLIKHQKDVKNGADHLINIKHFHSDSFKSKEDDAIFPTNSDFYKVAQKSKQQETTAAEKPESNTRTINKKKTRRSFDDEAIKYLG